MDKWFQSKSSELLTGLLLSFLLAITFIIALAMQAQSSRYVQLAFDSQVEQLVQSIELRMRDHEQLLLGAKGLFDASDSVSREEFNRYLAPLDLKRNYPGIQIVGYTQWIKPQELDQFTQMVRAQGFPQFNVRPAGERDYYSAIIYMEPFADRNMAAFGFDMFSESVRRQAMSAAVIDNHTRLSGKVVLVQEKAGNTYPGALLYLPVFKKNLPLDTEARRWSALQGFVYIGFRIEDLMKGILQQNRLDMRFRLYAGSVSADQRLYDSTPSVEPRFTPAYKNSRHMDLYGQSWLLESVSDKAFETARTSNRALIALCFGVVVSVLLCAIFYVIVNQRQRALALASAITADMRVKNVELKHSQERFELALESSAMGIWSLQFADNALQWDSYMYVLFGLSGDNTKLTYDRFFMCVHSDDRQRVFEEIAQAIEGKKGYDTEYRVVWPDHSIHYVASRAKIIYEANEAVSMIGTCWDISERKRLDKVKTEFVSTVSHELRTPLTAITGALGLAVSGALCVLPDNAKQVLDIAYKNAQRLKLLINDLLDMDKLLAGKLEFHCEVQLIMPLIERAVTENRAYADQMQVRFVIVPTESDPRINVEDIRFLQVMANFLSNAAKFSKPDSDVLVKLEVIDQYARVSVVDTGVGMDDESKSHMFEKFYQADSSDTRKKGGTGLGLAITKEIVERMNGRIGFSSVLGEGSTFYAEFPIVN